MRINHFVQADVFLRNGMGRFWMDTCGGRDQVAMTVLRKGWEFYEPPMPRIISTWCEDFAPTFLDVGANTGFYSLLALVSGAKSAHAFEPVTEIADIFAANADVSELTSKVEIHRCAVGEMAGEQTLYFPLDGHGLIETSASLSEDFRSKHSARKRVNVVSLDQMFGEANFNASPVILKIDVESREAAVLQGAERIVASVRPAIFAELLPESDATVFTELCEKNAYRHYALTDAGLIESADIVGSHDWRMRCP